MTFFKCSLIALAFALLAATQETTQEPPGETWRLDSLQQIGGHPVTVQGAPRIVDTPRGKAIQFNGIGDALFLDVHPLAGAATWTWEVIFRPESGGAPEQRFFHLQENGSDSRMLFEIRVIDGKWCLDSFAKSGAEQATLIDRAKLHPLDAWYNVTAVYDGHQFRNYVNGRLEESAELHLAPHAPGKCSIGVRLNKVNYFKGAVAEARMTRRALPVDEFLKVQ